MQALTNLTLKPQNSKGAYGKPAKPAYSRDTAPKDDLLEILMDMFSYCRVGGGRAEADFIAEYILPLGPTLIDAMGNIYLDRRSSKDHRTLFVAHTDSVHHKDGRQNVFYDASKKIIHTDGYCLGADDAAGVALLIHMATQGVPGLYVWSRYEETGGKGAKFLVDTYPDLLAEFDRAVAFDRKDTFSVITHQGWGRCCSDEFANALSDEFNSLGMMYMPDDTGVYTDTAEFVDIIPECTNISTGYNHEHTSNEVLHYDHFQQLAEAVLNIKWDDLPTKRDVLDIEFDDGEKIGFAADFELGYEAANSADWEVQQYLEDALEGHVQELMYLIAEAVSPEDPEGALRMLDESSFDQAVVRRALSELKTTDSLTVLYRLFDDLAIYRDAF